MRYRSFRRGYLGRVVNILLVISALWTFFEVVFARRASVVPPTITNENTPTERLFIVSIHWNNEQILRSHWNQAVLDLVHDFGRDNVFVSIYESGSWDDSKGALRDLDSKLEKHAASKHVVLNDTTHADLINGPPADEGWVDTPRGRTELRRIPYLADLRNEALKPLYELAEKGITFDQILFLNDVVFTTDDVRRLLATRDGDYAAACSLDFKSPPKFYDTFALRDTEGHAALMQAWPYFRGRESRQAIKSGRPVPVASCWNGMVAMKAQPFYEYKERQTARRKQLSFRGISDSLATYHVEGSECCLIHVDNPLTSTDGVWLNPAVRVGYTGAAYEQINPKPGRSWLSVLDIVFGSWENRLLRWFTTEWFRESVVTRRLRSWRAANKTSTEEGWFCLINEMQTLIDIGWAHV